MAGSPFIRGLFGRKLGDYLGASHGYDADPGSGELGLRDRETCASAVRDGSAGRRLPSRMSKAARPRSAMDRDAWVMAASLLDRHGTARVVSLYRERYLGWTVKHFHERAQERQGLTVRGRFFRIVPETLDRPRILAPSLSPLAPLRIGGHPP
jgi:hypothetical protein